ncbi:unnamed protein product [Cercospora beticola]|nr:unnamed protein product [Cercospora beticola]
MTLFITSCLWLALGFQLADCVLELPVFSEPKGHHSGARVRARQSQGPLEGDIYYNNYWYPYGGYYIDITIGTPPQRQTVWVSTGSVDLYVDSITAATCNSSSATPEPCRGGTFNSSASGTYEEVAESPAFEVSYADGNEIIGPIGSDVLGIGQLQLEDVQFGVGEEINVNEEYPLAMMGLGYSTLSSVNRTGLSRPYQNVPEVMVRANLSESRLFSIALGRPDTSGSLVFGGLDTTRYVGELATIDLMNNTRPYIGIDGKNTTAPRRFITTITGAEFTAGNNTTTLWSSDAEGMAAWNLDDPAVAVIPSTASQTMLLPYGHYAAYILPYFPFLTPNGSCICDYADTEDKITFTFGGKIKIEVGVKDLIKQPVDLAAGRPLQYANGSDQCTFMITPDFREDEDEKTWYSLGGPVLESMFMVFDMDNNQISIAQAATEVAETSNIIAIEAGPGQVARVAASLRPSATPSGGVPTPSGTNTPVPDPTPVNTGAIAGGVVGGVGGLALIGAAAYFLVRRKRKTEMRPMSEVQNDFGQDFDGTYVQQPKNPRYNGDPTLE